MALLRVVAVAVIFSMVFESASAVVDCTQLPVYVSNAQCKEYASYGAADVAVDRLRLSDIEDADKEIFQLVLANVSNKYYPSIKIQPQNIAIVELFETRDGVLMISFFVMNPSASEVFPILFRITELTLMIELNLKFINTHLPFDVEPQPPEDTYPLFFPIWAIVIIVYLLIVIIGFLIILATKNWDDTKTGGMDVDVESTDGGGGAVLIKKSYTSYSEDDYAVVQRKRTRTDSSLNNNNITEVDHPRAEVKDQSMQTPRTVAMQVRPSDIDSTTTATIEKEPGSPASTRGSRRSDSLSDEGEVNDGYDMVSDDNMTTAF